jgi:sugar lactone lactonase YvrE
MHALKVMTVDPAGRTGTIVEVRGQPGGLGFLPDGRLLVVSQTDRRLWRLDSGVLTEVANLSNLATGSCNDMVVDRQGRAYIGNFGAPTDGGPARYTPADVIIVKPDGEVRSAAGGLSFPNGMAITPDGRTLIVAESFGHCLTAFEIGADGSLTGRRVWAQLPDTTPDGICLDAEGAVWVATIGKGVIRVAEGGKITDRVNVSTRAFACMLGGADRRTLFIMAADTFVPDEAKAKRSGRIETVRVDVPGSGLP